MNAAIWTAPLWFDMPFFIAAEIADMSLKGEARLTRQAAVPMVGGRWVAVTYSVDIPGAVRTFSAAGWPGITSHPVDRKMRSWFDDHAGEFCRNLIAPTAAVRKRVGWAVNAMSGS